MKRALIAGVGMTPFTKPGRSSLDYPQLAAIAIRAALADTKAISFDQVQAAVCGFVFSESCSGNRAMYEVGMTGIPIINVNNNCCTGATALMLGQRLVRGGIYECVLCVGFEKMNPGSIKWGANPNTESPMQIFYDSVKRSHPEEAPSGTNLANPYMFAMVAREHMRKYGSQKEHFAMVGMKNHQHSAKNPFSQFRDVYTLDQILGSPLVYEPLTRLQCSPTSDGAAAALIVSEEFARDKGIFDRCVEIMGCEMRTDTHDSCDGSSAISAVGYGMTKRCADQLYEATNTRPSDVQDTDFEMDGVNDLVSYESLGLVDEGKGHTLIERGDTTYGGRWLVNPLGATGLAQAYECVSQVRGEAGDRQRKECELAMSMNLGMGGAVVCTMYKMAS